MHPLLSLQGLFVDEAGFVLEGPNSNFAILTEDDVFVTPPFDNVLAGVTIQRLMELLPEVRGLLNPVLALPVCCLTSRNAYRYSWRIAPLM